MARKPQETQVTNPQAQAAAIAGQGMMLAAGTVDTMRMTIRINSEAAGSPQRGTNTDCTLTTIVAFLMFRSAEVMLKAAIGMEEAAFLQVHTLARLHDLLPSEAQERLEEDWRQRGSSKAEDANGVVRPRTFREALAYIDRFNLNESLYWWTKSEFALDVIDNFMSDDSGQNGVLADVQATISDTTVVRSGRDYAETSIADVLAPLFEDRPSHPLNIVRARSGLVVPRIIPPNSQGAERPSP